MEKTVLSKKEILDFEERTYRAMQGDELACWTLVWQCLHDHEALTTDQIHHLTLSAQQVLQWELLGSLENVANSIDNAHILLGTLYYLGLGELQQDDVQANFHFSGVRNPTPQVLYFRAMMCQNGFGEPENKANYAQAKEFFKQQTHAVNRRMNPSEFVLVEGNYQVQDLWGDYESRVLEYQNIVYRWEHYQHRDNSKYQFEMSKLITDFYGKQFNIRRKNDLQNYNAACKRASEKIQVDSPPSLQPEAVAQLCRYFRSNLNLYFLRQLRYHPDFGVRYHHAICFDTEIVLLKLAEEDPDRCLFYLLSDELLGEVARYTLINYLFGDHLWPDDRKTSRIKAIMGEFWRPLDVSAAAEEKVVHCYSHLENKVPSRETVLRPDSLFALGEFLIHRARYQLVDQLPSEIPNIPRAFLSVDGVARELKHRDRSLARSLKAKIAVAMVDARLSLGTGDCEEITDICQTLMQFPDYREAMIRLHQFEQRLREQDRPLFNKFKKEMVMKTAKIHDEKPPTESQSSVKPLTLEERIEQALSGDKVACSLVVWQCLHDAEALTDDEWKIFYAKALAKLTSRLAPQKASINQSEAADVNIAELDSIKTIIGALRFQGLGVAQDDAEAENLFSRVQYPGPQALHLRAMIILRSFGAAAKPDYQQAERLFTLKKNESYWKACLNTNEARATIKAYVGALNQPESPLSSAGVAYLCRLAGMEAWITHLCPQHAKDYAVRYHHAATRANFEDLKILAQENPNRCLSALLDDDQFSIEQVLRWCQRLWPDNQIATGQTGLKIKSLFRFYEFLLLIAPYQFAADNGDFDATYATVLGTANRLRDALAQSEIVKFQRKEQKLRVQLVNVTLINRVNTSAEFAYVFSMLLKLCTLEAVTTLVDYLIKAKPVWSPAFTDEELATVIISLIALCQPSREQAQHIFEHIKPFFERNYYEAAYALTSEASQKKLREGAFQKIKSFAFYCGKINEINDGQLIVKNPIGFDDYFKKSILYYAVVVAWSKTPKRQKSFIDNVFSLPGAKIDNPDSRHYGEHRRLCESVVPKESFRYCLLAIMEFLKVAKNCDKDSYAYLLIIELATQLDAADNNNDLKMMINEWIIKKFTSEKIRDRFCEEIKERYFPSRYTVPKFGGKGSSLN